jgi:hypothetical protein
MNFVGHGMRVGDTKIVYRILLGDPERERPLGSLQRKWEDNIKINLKEIWWDFS